MTSNEAESGRTVRCPICMDLVAWSSGQQLYMWNPSEASYEQVNYEGTDLVRRLDLIRRSYRRCPNPSGDTPEHFLPAGYDLYRPMIVGLVGGSACGKTHLLAAMLREILRGGLSPYGIRCEPYDFLCHERFRRHVLLPFEMGVALGGTAANIQNYAEMLLLRGPAGDKIVVLFDVAGEDLEDAGARAARFLVAADAFIFVYSHEYDRADRVGRAGGDSSFGVPLARIRSLSDAGRRIAAVAVTKSDRLRYAYPADRWLRASDSVGKIDHEAMRAESRDVFAWLRRQQEMAAIDLLEVFSKCTLHFVSATGGDSSGNTFPRGIEPLRALRPFVALLAMSGLIPGDSVDLVGL